MRLRNQYSLREREGEMRVRRKFLWWPCTLPSSSHTRWLEYADVVEVVEKESYASCLNPTQHKWRWAKIGFADELTSQLVEEHYGSCGVTAFKEAHTRFYKTLRVP